MKIYYLLFLLISLFIQVGYAQSNQAINHFFNPASYSRCTAYDSNTNNIYIGGDFNYSTRTFQKNVLLNQTNGNIDIELPYFNNIYQTGFYNAIISIPNNDNGFIVSAYGYDPVNDSAFTNIAQIDSIGNLLPWELSLNHRVNSMKFLGDDLIIGGDYTEIEGNSFSYLSKVNVLSSQVIPFNTTLNGNVRQLEIYNSEILILGNFDTIDGLSRKGIAKIDIATGSLSSWVSPIDSGYLRQFSIHNDILYVIGTNMYVNSNLYANIIAIDLLTGIPLAWNPYFNASILAIDKIDDTLFFAGGFSTINGVPYNYLVKYNTTNSTFNSVDNSLDGSILSMKIDKGVVYVSGNFTTFFGQSNMANKIGVYNFNSNTSMDLTNYDPFLFSPQSISSNNTHVFLGNFNAVQADFSSSNLICLAIETGEKSALPIVNGTVFDLLIKGDTLFIAGDFTLVNNVPRQNFAALQISTQTLLPISFNCNGAIRSLEIHQNKLFFGGDFITVNGIQKRGLGFIDIYTGVVNSWNPNIINAVLDIEIENETLFIGGIFQTVSGQNRNRLASFDLQSMTLTNWNPSVDNIVYTIKYYQNYLYVGGDFSTINNLTYTHIAKFDINTLELSDWNPMFNSIVYSIDGQDNKVYIGGIFTQVNGLSRIKNASFSAQTGNLLNWQATGTNSVLNINCLGNYIAFSGEKLKVYKTYYSFSDFENLNLCSEIIDTVIYFNIYNPNNYPLTFTTASSDNAVISGNSLQVDTNTNGNGYLYKITLTPLLSSSATITITVIDSINQSNSVTFNCLVGLSNSTEFSNCPSSFSMCEGEYYFDYPILTSPCGVNVTQLFGETSGTYLIPGVYSFVFESSLAGIANNYCEYDINVVDCILSNETTLFKKIYLFPNPVNDELFIQFNTNQTIITDYIIMDATGKIIASGNLNLTYTINCSSISKGFYFIKLLDVQGNQYDPIPFIKQ